MYPYQWVSFSPLTSVNAYSSWQSPYGSIQPNFPATPLPFPSGITQGLPSFTFTPPTWSPAPRHFDAPTWNAPVLPGSPAQLYQPQQSPWGAIQELPACQYNPSNAYPLYAAPLLMTPRSIQAPPLLMTPRSAQAPPLLMTPTLAQQTPNQRPSEKRRSSPEHAQPPPSKRSRRRDAVPVPFPCLSNVSEPHFFHSLDSPALPALSPILSASADLIFETPATPIAVKATPQPQLTTPALKMITPARRASPHSGLPIVPPKMIDFTSAVTSSPVDVAEPPAMVAVSSTTPHPMVAVPSPTPAPVVAVSSYSPYVVACPQRETSPCERLQPSPVPSPEVTITPPQPIVFASKPSKTAATTKASTAAKRGQPRYTRPRKGCNICHKTFANRSILEFHLRYAHETGPRKLSDIKCDVCGKIFSHPASLMTHVRQHTGERPWSCDVCDFTATDRAVYTRHLRRHTGARPYMCDVCGQSFTQSCNLQRHIKTGVCKR